MRCLKPLISFFQSGGCWSYIGRLWSRVNEISIGRGCEWQSTIQHEVMHALGFHHEQVPLIELLLMYGSSLQQFA